MEKVKVMSDGFVVFVLDKCAAYGHFNDHDEMMVVHDDGSDTMIESIEQIDEAINNGEEVCLSLDFVSHLAQQMENIHSN